MKLQNLLSSLFILLNRCSKWQPIEHPGYHGHQHHGGGVGAFSLKQGDVPLGKTHK